MFTNVIQNKYVTNFSRVLGASVLTVTLFVAGMAAANRIGIFSISLFLVLVSFSIFIAGAIWTSRIMDKACDNVGWLKEL